MNEWKQLLRQTHPQFQILTVEEALKDESLNSTELSTATPEESVLVASEVLQVEAELESESETQAGSPMETQADTSSSEIEWISPTHKLQSKIENIPDKFGFKIGEAADYVGVKQYVLRYWESEFDILRPKKSKNGQRVYSKKDVETALIIKKLLHEDRFSIEGAQSALRKLRKQVKEKLHDQPHVEREPVAARPEAVINRQFLNLSLQLAQDLLSSIRGAREQLRL